MYASDELIKLLKKELKEQEIAKTELAKKTGCTTRALDYWLNGKRRMSLNQADKILSELGISFMIGKR